MGFSDELAAACGDKWERMHTHPFVKEIGDGTLPVDKYSFYLEQDYLYLIEFCRLLAVLASKAPDLETMGRFKDLLASTLDFEMDLHVRTCDGFGITRSQLEAVEPAPSCLAYTSFLLSVARGGEFADGVVALLPCAWGYYEVGRRLAGQCMPDVQHYREWIETYSCDEMKELVDYLRLLADRIGAAGDSGRKKRWEKIFERSVDFEIMFWEMGYHKLSEVSETG